MKASSPLLTHQRRAQSVPPSPSISPDNLKKLVETPYFKRLVQLHVNLRCRQALKEGKIRLASPQNPIFLPRYARSFQVTVYTDCMDFRVDIVDDSSSPRIVATFELPGVRNDELTMHLHDGKLHIHGERRPRISSRTNGDRADPQQPLSGTSDEASSNDMAVDSPPRQITIPTQELKYGKFQRTLDVPRDLKAGVFASMPYFNSC
jgi:HSP20 family protein